MGHWGQLKSKLEPSIWLREERAPPVSAQCCQGEQPAAVHGQLLAQGAEVAWEQFLLIQVISEDEGGRAGLQSLAGPHLSNSDGAWHPGAESGSPQSAVFWKINTQVPRSETLKAFLLSDGHKPSTPSKWKSVFVPVVVS